MELFGQYGNILSAKVFIDKATGLSKCYGFVSYESTDSAQSAITGLNGYNIENKFLKVEIRRPRN